MPRVNYEPPKAYRLKYMVVNAPDLTDLHYKVNDQLSKGWRLQGGIAIFRGYPCQAMVKEEEI
jgi:hypothetical protein|nr:MAG TPA: protein of unknown function (DUF1737) [Caudoviricetes sp.]